MPSTRSSDSPDSGLRVKVNQPTILERLDDHDSRFLGFSEDAKYRSNQREEDLMNNESAHSIFADRLTRIEQVLGI